MSADLLSVDEPVWTLPASVNRPYHLTVQRDLAVVWTRMRERPLRGLMSPNQWAIFAADHPVDGSPFDPRRGVLWCMGMEILPSVDVPDGMLLLHMPGGQRVAITGYETAP